MIPTRPSDADPWDDLRRLAAEPFVILDTETTGLFAPEVVSIAVIDDGGRPLLHEIVCPAKPIEPDAERITGIRFKELSGKPAFPTIARDVAAAIGGRRVVIYNAAYDVGVLENTHRRYGLAMPAFEPWCAMNWFARVYGQWDAARGAFTWQSLRKAAAHFDLPVEGAHNALADCLTTLNVLRAAMRKAGVHASGMDRLF